jgi:hypothetical protein
MAPLAIGLVNGPGFGGPLPPSIEPSVSASDRAAFERALATLPPGLIRKSAEVLQTVPGATTSPGDRILASIQGSRSLASPADVLGGEDVGSVLTRAEARLERAQTHLEQVQARLEQWEIKREARLEDRLDRAQARLEEVQARLEQIPAHQLERAQAHLEKVQAHLEKMRAHFEEVEQHLLAKAQARVDEAQAYLEEVQAGQQAPGPGTVEGTAEMAVG